MDPRTNPFAPGAGNPPPQLAGRHNDIENAAIALDRIRLNRSARSFVFYGLRGVGKTVLLSRIKNEADSRGFVTFMIEAPEGKSLPAMLVPHLRALLLRVSQSAKTKDKVNRAFHALAGFIGALKFKYQDIEASLRLPSIPGLADSGDFETDLADLFIAIGDAAKDAETAAVLFLDELQYLPQEQLAVLISAFHTVSKEQSPIVMVAAGLPQLLGQMGKAKSYAERLFEFVPIGPLVEHQLHDAVYMPITDANVAIDDNAMAEIFNQTQGYPYFVQEWGKHSWNCGRENRIDIDAVFRASDLVV